MVALPPVRILADYRAALRDRTGAGEFVHNLLRAYTHHPVAAGDAVTLFTSSWKDRPDAGATAELKASIVDRKIPVSLLNFAWHRLEWPPVETVARTVAGAFDVVHAAHPLLIPVREAAQVVTIHDLFFLTEPEQTRAEIRRDYPALARDHAHRADAVVTSSRYTAGLLAARLGVSLDRIHVCPPGPPVWSALGRAPNLPAGGYVLFVGTLEPRKNVGLLLDAYARLIERGTPVPALVLAGRATPDAAGWLARLERPPLAGKVRHLGYVLAEEREQLFAGARLLVLPSHDEGFGLPVLEAMSAGIPVIASDRGSLPEVLGDAGVLVGADDPDRLADALVRVLAPDGPARDYAERGLARAREFSWDRAARALRTAYEQAIVTRHSRRRAAA